MALPCAEAAPSTTRSQPTGPTVDLGLLLPTGETDSRHLSLWTHGRSSWTRGLPTRPVGAARACEPMSTAARLLDAEDEFYSRRTLLEVHI